MRKATYAIFLCYFLIGCDAIQPNLISDILTPLPSVTNTVTPKPSQTPSQTIATSSTLTPTKEIPIEFEGFSEDLIEILLPLTEEGTSSVELSIYEVLDTLNPENRLIFAMEIMSDGVYDALDTGKVWKLLDLDAGIQNDIVRMGLLNSNYIATVPYEKFVVDLGESSNPPELLVWYLNHHFRYVKDFDGNQYDPANVAFSSGSGDCDEYSILSSVSLGQIGLEAYFVGIGIDGPHGHSVAAFRYPDELDYYFITNGKSNNDLQQGARLFGPFIDIIELADFVAELGYAPLGSSIRIISSEEIAINITKPLTDETYPSVTGLPWTVLRK